MTTAKKINFHFFYPNCCFCELFWLNLSRPHRERSLVLLLEQKTSETLLAQPFFSITETETAAATLRGNSKDRTRSTEEKNPSECFVKSFFQVMKTRGSEHIRSVRSLRRLQVSSQWELWSLEGDEKIYFLAEKNCHKNFSSMQSISNFFFKSDIVVVAADACDCSNP